MILVQLSLWILKQQKALKRITQRQVSYLLTVHQWEKRTRECYDWIGMFFFTPFFLSLNIAAPHRCSLIFMNNCLGWILAIAFTFISPHGTSSSVSQHTPPTTDPGSALHGNIILHSVAKKEVLTSALHEQQIEISALVTALCTLCAFHVLTTT